MEFMFLFVGFGIGIVVLSWENRNRYGKIIENKNIQIQFERDAKISLAKQLGSILTFLHKHPDSSYLDSARAEHERLIKENPYRDAEVKLFTRNVLRTAESNAFMKKNSDRDLEDALKSKIEDYE